MNYDDKTESFELNSKNDNATESIDLGGMKDSGTEIINTGSSPSLSSGTGNESISEYMKGEVIGGYSIDSLLSKESGEAEIYLAEKEGQTSVVKYYHSNMQPKEDILKKIKNLDHPDIIKLHDYGWHQGRFYEILEYASGGTLGDRGPDGKYRYIPLHADRINDIIHQVSNAFKYMHEKGIIHRDIKPANLFLKDSEKHDIIIGDFGISSELDIEGGMSKRMTTTGSRTTGYAAPELYLVGKDDNQQKVKIGPEVDYYALGVTVFELLTGVDIFAGRNDISIAWDTAQGRIIEDMLTRPEAESLSPRLKNLIKGLLTIRHDKRWGYGQVTDWLAGKEVEVFANIPLAQFRPLKFEGRVLNSMEEIVSALDEDRQFARKILMRAELEKWAVSTNNKHLSDRITELRESDLDDNTKVGALIYLLDPERPFRVDNETELTDMEGFREVLRKKPETMTALVLGEKESDLYSWLSIVNAELADLIMKETDLYRKEGDETRRLSVVSRIYLAFAGKTIQPFSDDDYKVSEVSDILDAPVTYREKIAKELSNFNSILYIWLIRQKTPAGFESDWHAMDKTWANLKELLSGNIEYIRQQKIKEAKRFPEKLRHYVLGTGILSALAVVFFLGFLISWTSDFYSLPGLSSYAYPPEARKSSYIYTDSNIKKRSARAYRKFIKFNPALSKSEFSNIKRNSMVPVKYYVEGAVEEGFMIKRDLRPRFVSGELLFFFIPMTVMCLFSLAGIATVFTPGSDESFYSKNKWIVSSAATAGTLGSASVFIVPLFIYFDRWKLASKRCDSQISSISSSRFTNNSSTSGATRKKSNFENGDMFDGEIKNGKRNGYGVYTFANGSRYEGEFKDDLFEGRGVFFYASGDRYEGEYKNDRRNGKGTYIFADGEKFEGEYRNDQRHGKGKLTGKDGSVKEGIWENGEYTG